MHPALLSAALLLLAGPPATEPSPWTELAPGLEWSVLASPRPSERGDSMVRVLRIDPASWEFRLASSSMEDPGRPRSAREWCRVGGFTAAINASMYQKDSRSSVSLMRSGDHVNNPRLSKDRTLFAFAARADSLPPVRIIDRDCDDWEGVSQGYDAVVQSIRMVSCRGENVWAEQDRSTSTAAIALDSQGRVLFIHVRSPYATHDLIEILLELPLDVERCMYTEGGAESQLYVTVDEFEAESVGRVSFLADDAAGRGWAVPNVVAIVPRETP